MLIGHENRGAWLVFYSASKLVNPDRAATDQDFGDRNALFRGVAVCDRVARMAIPVRRIRKITFDSMQPGMHPRAIAALLLLSEFVGFSPVPTQTVPECK